MYNMSKNFFEKIFLHSHIFGGLLTFIFMHLLRCKYLEIECYICGIRRLAST